MAAPGRAALSLLAARLGSRDAALRRDECGDWRITGKHGHVYCIGDRFLFFVQPDSARQWTFAKRALNFAELVNDGDAEGLVSLGRLPTATEAAILRRCLGLAKKKVMAEADLERLRRLGFRARTNDQPEKPSSNDKPGS